MTEYTLEKVTDDSLGKRKKHNLKRRDKVKAKRAAKREALLTSEPIITTVVKILDDPKADIFLIKKVIDKVTFHNLYESLVILGPDDELKALQQAAAAHEWNKAEHRILNVILPLACVIADQIRQDE